MSTHQGRRSARRTQLLGSLHLAGRRQSNAVVMFHTAVAGRLGLSATDEKLLDLLEREGSLTAGQLVERTGLAPSSITAAVDRLERKRFVRRRRDPLDQRRVTVELTGARLDEARDLFAGLVRRLDRVYADFTDDELAVILRFLDEASVAQHAATEELVSGR